MITLRSCLLVASLLIALPLSAHAEVRGFARVIDGDTLDVAGTRVRLFGIDAPEMAQPCDTPQGAWSCGHWAQQVLVELTRGLVTCQGIENDRYGRLVARCEAGHGDLGAAMVEAGAATAFRRYSRDYVRHESRAQRAQRGIWQRRVLGRVDPAQFRADRRVTTVSDAAPEGCAIKGNISSNGRIYHRPGQRDYDRTRINLANGERWFCSESEAREAGWRAARR